MTHRSSEPADLELAFVMAAGQNLFFTELVAALRQEIEGLGITTSLHVGNFPAPEPQRIYVLTPPHEYFTLLHGRHGPLPEVLARTIFICGEQPGSGFFENNLHLGPMGGAVFDINRFGVRAFARAGIEARHLQLGWTKAWDHFEERERDIDVLYMGSHTERRARVIGSFARTLSRYNNVFVFSDNARPNWQASGSYFSDADKWKLLSRAKILLNVHQENNHYFEWLRVVQAMSTGAVVVSEHSIDYAPLVAGTHLLLGEPESLGLLCAHLLADDERRRQIQSEAYRTVKDELALARGVRGLIDAARRLAQSPAISETDHQFFIQPQPRPEEVKIIQSSFEPTSASNGDANASWTRRALKDLRLELMQLRRDQSRVELETLRGGPLRALEPVGQTLAFAGARPQISVITALYNHAKHVPAALSSAARSYDVDVELIIVDDGSYDGSAEAVLRWMSEHENVPARIVRHPVNRGLAAARNDALGLARGSLVFVLDADNEVYRRCLRRLQDTLEADPDAAFSYCTLEMFAGSDCVGLGNVFPWQPERFRAHNYIDAQALFRTAVIRDELGGYPTDRRLYGWEDYALYCRIASAGYQGARDPEILGRYRVARHSMLGLTNISATEAFSVIIEANPELMAGIEAPD